MDQLSVRSPPDLLIFFTDWGQKYKAIFQAKALYWCQRLWIPHEYLGLESKLLLASALIKLRITYWHFL